MDKIKLKERIVGLVQNHAEDLEIYTNQFPHHTKAILEFLGNNECDLGEEDIFLLHDRLFVDSDGYPCYQIKLIILPLEIVVTMIACHHSEWDYYLEDEAKAKKAV